MRDPDVIEAPDGLDEEPEEPYRPLLAAEERKELRREWLASARSWRGERAARQEQ